MLDELCSALGTSKSTLDNMATHIRELLNIGALDPALTVPSKLDDNPMVRMPSVNRLVVDIRFMPLEAQHVAYE